MSQPLEGIFRPTRGKELTLFSEAINSSVSPKQGLLKRGRISGGTEDNPVEIFPKGI